LKSPPFGGKNVHLSNSRQAEDSRNDVKSGMRCCKDHQKFMNSRRRSKKKV